MKLILENVGSIKKGEIDLDRDFYVFVGKNNSGKTYVSQILWELMNIKDRLSNKINLNDINLEGDKIEITQKIIDDILLQVKELIMKNVVRTRTFSDILTQQSNLKFIEPLDNFKIQGGSVKSKSTSADDSLIYDIKVSKNKDESCVRFEIKYYKNKETLAPNKKRLFIKVILNTLFPKEGNRSFLPANRIFFPSFWKYIDEYERNSKSLISKELEAENYEMAKKLSRPNYTSVINDILSRTNKINDIYPSNNFYNHEILELQKIMAGDISVQNFLGKPDFKFNIPEKELDMHLTSSSVNQLTLLYLYFRYWTSKMYNFLMIDEPEENLHPENQVKLLELLIGFSQKNHNKVLITTHSPFFTDAINNYLMLGNIDAEKREETAQELGMKMWLEKEKTGIYYFDGERIIEYEVGEYGTTFWDFREVQQKIKKATTILDEKLFNQYNK